MPVECYFGSDEGAGGAEATGKAWSEVKPAEVQPDQFQATASRGPRDVSQWGEERDGIGSREASARMAA